MESESGKNKFQASEVGYRQMMLPFAVKRERGGRGRLKEKTKSVIDLMNLRYLWYECGEIH